MIRTFGASVLSLVFPIECEICEAVLSPRNDTAVCPKCESDIRWIRPPHCVSCGRNLSQPVKRCGRCLSESFHFDRAYACASYEGAMRELLHRYKFKRRKALRRFFVKAMENFLRANLSLERFDSLVAVPLDEEKLKSRGFNQSRLLTSRLSKILGVRDDSKELGRRKSSSPQSLLTKSDRKTNIQGCFFVNHPGPLWKDKRLLLIDDILTSGQTASECARVLKEAGAASVTVLACARGV